LPGSVCSSANDLGQAVEDLLDGEDERLVIVMLNGTSSSGKTALARALQLQWRGPLLHLGTDTAHAMLPASYVGMKPTAHDGIHFYIDTDDRGPVVRVRSGSVGKKLEASFARVAQVLADDGHDLVLDLVLFDPSSLASYVQALHSHRTYFIGVHCEPGVLEARELVRGNRFQGLARAQQSVVHESRRFYDLEVDTTSLGPHELAQSIVEFVNSHPKPASMSLLYSRLFSG
jgi:chloramphenicol 3-O phosphotransferase